MRGRSALRSQLRIRCLCMNLFFSCLSTALTHGQSCADTRSCSAQTGPREAAEHSPHRTPLRSVREPLPASSVDSISSTGVSPRLFAIQGSWGTRLPVALGKIAAIVAACASCRCFSHFQLTSGSGSLSRRPNGSVSRTCRGTAKATHPASAMPPSHSIGVSISVDGFGAVICFTGAVWPLQLPVCSGLVAGCRAILSTATLPATKSLPGACG